jgi:hypothetical protein
MFNYTRGFDAFDLRLRLPAVVSKFHKIINYNGGFPNLLPLPICWSFFVSKVFLHQDIHILFLISHCSEPYSMNVYCYSYINMSTITYNPIY